MKNLDEKLLKACEVANLEEVKTLVEKGADVNAKTDKGWTALINASCNGHLEIVKFLVEKGADVNAQNEDAETAWMHASANGFPEIAEFLIENGANEINEDSGVDGAYGHGTCKKCGSRYWMVAKYTWLCEDCGYTEPFHGY